MPFEKGDEVEVSNWARPPARVTVVGDGANPGWTRVEEAVANGRHEYEVLTDKCALVVDAGEMSTSDGLGADEDRIEDGLGNVIRVGTRVHEGDAEGTVVKVRSCSDRDGHPPTFDVEFDACPDAPETQGTSVRDYRSEGPNGPFVYVADDVQVL